MNLRVEFFFDSLEQLVAASPNPSDELLDRAQSDGASRVFALLFGWLFAAIYFAIWFGLFHIGQWVWKRFRPAKTSLNLGDGHKQQSIY